MKKPCLPDLFNPITFQVRDNEYIGGSETRIDDNFKKIQASLFSVRSIGSIKYSLQSEDHDGWVFATDGRCLPRNAFPQLERIYTNSLSGTNHYFIPPIGSISTEDSVLNGFVYVGPAFPTFVEPPLEECPQLFVPERYLLACNELPMSASTMPYSSVYFSIDDGETPIEWSDNYYTVYLFETDYNHSVSLYGLDGVREFMRKRFPLSILNEEDGFWVGPSPDPYIKVRLTQPMTLVVNAVSANEVTIPLIAKGMLPFNEGVIDWGDGTTSLIEVNQNPKHTYSASGNYIVTYRGSLREVGWLSSEITKTYFSGVSAWGNTGISAISFEGGNITILDTNLHTSVSSIKNMFKDCQLIPSSVSALSVGDVEIFDGVFENYSGTNIPNINSWNVSNAISMKGMFRSYKSSEIPIISSWNVENVKDMSYMFANSNIVPMISGWNVENVENMDSMFRLNQSPTINIGAWKTYNLKNAKSMFQGIQNSNPSLSAWTTSSIQYFDYMFADTILANPDVSSWDMSNVVSLEGMFQASRAANPVVTNWNTRSLKNAKLCFSQMALGSNINISAWNVSACNNFDGMFKNSSNINPNLTACNFTGLQGSYLRGEILRSEGLNEIFTGSGLTSANFDIAINKFYNDIYLVGALSTTKVTDVVVGIVPGAATLQSITTQSPIYSKFVILTGDGKWEIMA